jgi:hypothetical protein
MMKRIGLLMCAFLLLAGGLFAQDQTARERGQGRGPGGTPVSITGKLEWINGHIAIKANEKTYYVSGVDKLVGFVDGVKEGAQVSLSGKEFRIPAIPEYGFLRTEVLSLNGKDYKFDDFPDWGHRRGMLGGMRPAADRRFGNNKQGAEGKSGR